MTNNNNSDEKEESFIQHLEALRRMLLNSIISVMVLSPVGFYLAPKFIDFLVKNSVPEKIGKLHYFSPMEVFILQLKMGLVIAFILAFPVIIAEVRRFVLPALYKNERKFLTLLVVLATTLFIFGAGFCIYFILPLIMKFSATFATSELQATLGLSSFINLSSMMILAFGLMFQFPLFVLMGVKFGLVKVKTLQNLRPYIIVGILILAAIFTPPDIVSQLMLGIPTWLLFEVGLFAAKFLEKSEA